MAKVALVGPLSGTFGWVGQGLLRGAAAAFGTDGGVELVPIDTVDAFGGLGAVAREIAVDGEFAAVLGPTFSREVEAMGPVLSHAGVPFVLPLATKPALGNQGWPCFFRIVASDSARGSLTGRFMRDELGSSRPSVACERSQSAQRAASSVADVFEEAGCSPSVAPMLDRGTHDVSAVAAGIVAAGSDAVFYAGEYREAALLRQALVSLGLGGRPFVADEGALTQDFVAACSPEYAEGVFSVGPGSPSAVLSAVDGRELDSKHTAFVAEGYQCGSLLYEAIRTAGTERAAITRRLHIFDGRVAGRAIRFTPDGENAHQTFYVYQVQAGNWTYWADVSNEPSTTRVAATERKEHDRV